MAVKSLMKALGLPAGDLRKPLTGLDGDALAKGVRIVQRPRARQDLRLQGQADLGRRGVNLLSPFVPAKAGTQLFLAHSTRLGSRFRGNERKQFAICEGN